ncbi:TnpV protein [Lientehia hominis]
MSEADRAAQEHIDAMLPRMMETAGVAKELKARSPMKWMRLMNSLKAQIEELILQELVYT